MTKKNVMYRTPSVMGSAHVNRMCGYVGDVLAMDYFFQSFCNIWVSVTPSDNYFTILPHNLALLHSTLLHSYSVPLRRNCLQIVDNLNY